MPIIDYTMPDIEKSSPPEAGGVIRYKITPEQIAEKGVVAAPDTLTGTAQENKGVFDRLVREIVAPAVNAALDELKEVEDNNEEWAKAEAERVENENERIANETERQENEQARIAAEQARETAEQERKTAEDQRGTAEQARQAAEAARAAAEVQRQANEQARDTAEKGRESAEGKREQAEQARALWETYDPQKAYVPGNKVSFGGSSYVNIKPSTGTAPTDGGHWLLIAAKGLDGQGSGDMTRAVYDPTGKAQDIFAYADKAGHKVIDFGAQQSGTAFSITAEQMAQMLDDKPPDVHVTLEGMTITLRRYDKTSNVVYYSNVMCSQGKKHFISMQAMGESAVITSAEEIQIPTPQGTEDAGKMLVANTGGGFDLTAQSEVGFLPTSGGTMAGQIDMDGQKMIGLPEPAGENEAATKRYVDQTARKGGSGMSTFQKLMTGRLI